MQFTTWSTEETNPQCMSTLAIYHLIPELVEISWLMHWDQYLRWKVNLDILTSSIKSKRSEKNKVLLRITLHLLTDSVNKQETPNTNAIKWCFYNCHKVENIHITTPSIHKCNQEQKHNQTHHQCAQSPEYFGASFAVLFA